MHYSSFIRMEHNITATTKHLSCYLFTKKGLKEGPKREKNCCSHQKWPKKKSILVARKLLLRLSALTISVSLWLTESDLKKQLTRHILDFAMNFCHKFCFRFKTTNVNLKSRKSDISLRPIDDSASKLIFFFVFFAIIDQFWCQIINCLLRNITFTTLKMNVWCFEAKQKLWKKSTR